MRRCAAAHADGVHLVDVFGEGQDSRHRPEGSSQVVLVETGDDHANTPVGELGHQLGQSLVEKLRLIDAHHLDAELELRAQLGAVAHRAGVELALVARHQAARLVAHVGDRLEHLHPLAADDRAAQAAHELLALAGEHAAGDDLDMAGAALRSADFVHRASGTVRGMVSGRFWASTWT